MAVRIVQLGSQRKRGEGMRLGTVRRPPRGVPKKLHAKWDFYDVWLLMLAPSDELRRDLKEGDISQERFFQRYRAEMKRPDKQHLINLLAKLSHRTNFSVGCYCEDEENCHRSVLREFLKAAKAKIG
jgi:uncharacterized protein YeaO (DUF488 family)